MRRAATLTLLAVPASAVPASAFPALCRTEEIAVCAPLD
jgi:hypothetical protein